MNAAQEKQAILCQVANLAQIIREFCRSQKELWRQIPHLALEADGRTGYSETYHRAYTLGYWTLECAQDNGYYTLYVDLATGELVSSSFTKRSANDGNVLRIIADIDEIDASKIIAELRAAGRKPYFKYYIPEKQEEWRNKIRQQCIIERLYTRRLEAPPVTEEIF